ncbi:hypothetical protein GGF32_009006 [Allomyces javanicus]|nr:hypothetical protein GGF32_009006 [Allomyces javanicus]
MDTELDITFNVRPRHRADGTTTRDAPDLPCTSTAGPSRNEIQEPAVTLTGSGATYTANDLLDDTSLQDSSKMLNLIRMLRLAPDAIAAMVRKVGGVPVQAAESVAAGGAASALEEEVLEEGENPRTVPSPLPLAIDEAKNAMQDTMRGGMNQGETTEDAQVHGSWLHNRHAQVDHSRADAMDIISALNEVEKMNAQMDKDSAQKADAGVGLTVKSQSNTIPIVHNQAGGVAGPALAQIAGAVLQLELQAVAELPCDPRTTDSANRLHRDRPTFGTPRLSTERSSAPPPLLNAHSEMVPFVAKLSPYKGPRTGNWQAELDRYMELGPVHNVSLDVANGQVSFAMPHAPEVAFLTLAPKSRYGSNVLVGKSIDGHQLQVQTIDRPAQFFHSTRDLRALVHGLASKLQ